MIIASINTLKKAESGEMKVVAEVRGRIRPKYCASYTRKTFYPWQKVYNVGSRVIISEN